MRKLEKKEQIRIIEKLSLLAAGRWEQLDIKKLRGAVDCFRLRSGSYRVLIEKIKDELIIILIAGRYRKESYR